MVTPRAVGKQARPRKGGAHLFEPIKPGSARCKHCYHGRFTHWHY